MGWLRENSRRPYRVPECSIAWAVCWFTDNNSSSCTLMICALTALTCKKEFALKRHLISTSVFLGRKDLSPQQHTFGERGGGCWGERWGWLLAPSLPPSPVLCCVPGRAQRKGPERSSHLTGTAKRFLTLGDWWSFKALLWFLWRLLLWPSHYNSLQTGSASLPAFSQSSLIFHPGMGTTAFALGVPSAWRAHI